MSGWLKRPGAGWWRGAAGVRPGWRATLYMALLLALVAGEIWLLERLNPPWLRPEAELSAGLVALNELALLVPVLAASAVMAWLEGQPLRICTSLAEARPGRRLVAGLLAGILALSLLIAVLLAGGFAASRWRGLSPVELLANLAAWLGVSLLIGLTEELAFRGYLQRILARGMGFWPAALATSLIFGLMHVSNPHESVIGILNVFGAGLLLCLALKRTGSLWWSIGFHGGWDFSENFLYGTHDSGQACAGVLLDTLPHGAVWLSGGLAGPEGSLFGLATELLVAFAMLKLLRPGTTVFDMDQCAPKG